MNEGWATFRVGIYYVVRRTMYTNAHQWCINCNVCVDADDGEGSTSSSWFPQWDASTSHLLCAWITRELYGALFDAWIIDAYVCECCVVYARVCENKQVLKQIIFIKPSAAAEMKRLGGGWVSWFVFVFNKQYTNMSLWGGYFVMVAHLGAFFFGYVFACFLSAPWLCVCLCVCTTLQSRLKVCYIIVQFALNLVRSSSCACFTLHTHVLRFVS